MRELKNVSERLVIRRRSGPVDQRDLPDDVLGLSTRPVTSPLNAPAAPTRADELYDKLVVHGESFWSAVHPMFMSRDMTREELRVIITRGLRQTRGSYRQMLQLFNMPSEDYKPFLAFLTKHQCKVPFFQFRCAPAVSAMPEVRAS